METFTIKTERISAHLWRWTVWKGTAVVQKGTQETESRAERAAADWVYKNDGYKGK